MNDHNTAQPPDPATTQGNGHRAPATEATAQPTLPIQAAKTSRQAGPAATSNRRASITRLVRLGVGIVALAVALFGEKLAEDARLLAQPAPPALSWWLFGLAAVLFASALWPVPRLLSAQPNPFFSTVRAMPNRPLFLASLALAAVCSLCALPLFFLLNSDPDAQKDNWAVNTGSWLLWIAALVLFGLAWAVWERNTPAPEAGPETEAPGDRLPRRLEWLLIAGLFLLALLLRVPNLDSAPPGIWFDEAQNGLVGQQLVKPDATHLAFLGDKTQMGLVYFYFQGLVIKLFGASVWPLRIISALSGSLLVPMLYLLASRIYGWRVGLAAAGLLAVSSWNITLSRLGMNSMPTVALDVAAYLCVMQALRTGRLGYFAGGGVLLGLALHGYYPSRLVALVLLAVLVHRLITERVRMVRAVRAGVVIFAVGALLAFMPVGAYAVQHWQEYNGRVSEVSIFGQEGSDGDPNAFQDSLSKHLLMFNFKGDNNGRHNLPDQPMLDWLTAILCFVGLGSAALRAWRWQYFFPVVWFIAALSGGVLSLLFEAPQSHRTLENSVVTALLAGLTLGQLWELVSRVVAPHAERIVEAARLAARRPAPTPTRAPSAPRKPRPATPSLPTRTASGTASGTATTLPVRVRSAAIATPVMASTAIADAPEETALPAPTLPDADWATQDPLPAEEAALTGATETTLTRVRFTRRRLTAIALSALGILAAVAWVGAISVNRYFNIQIKDRGVWSSMYAAEAQAARVIARYSPDHNMLVAPILAGLPPSQYLAPDASPGEWPGLQAIPLSASDGKDTVIVLDPPSAADLSAIARIYPHATFEPLLAPADPGAPLMWTIYIPASDIDTLHGVYAQFFDPGATAPRESKTLSGMQLDWSQQSKPGAARLSATFKIETFGSYGFNWQSAGGNRQPNGLSVDGFPVQPNQPMQLAVGLHSVVATDTVQSLAGVSSLTVNASALPNANLFDPRKIEPRGLTGLFRQGDNFDNQPKQGRIDMAISAYFHLTPLERPYTAEWTGRIYIPTTGDYGFATEQLSRSRLFLDDKLIIENDAENRLIEYRQKMTAGWHNIKLQYEDLSGYSHVYLYWTAPNNTRSIIPSAFLFPVMGEYPTQPESGPLPTLDQANGNNLPPDRVILGGAAPSAAPGASSQPPVQPPQNATQPPTQATAAKPAIPGEAMEPLFALGVGSSGPTTPQTAAVDASGNIYVYSDKGSQIYKYAPDEKLITQWPVKDAAGKPLAEGSALVVQGDSVLLLDASTSNLLSYTLDGKSQPPVLLCQCYYPRAMSLAADGKGYWVADTGGARIIKVDLGASGAVLKSIQGPGKDVGKFSDPAGVAESRQGTLFVADNGNARVQAFGPDLIPLAHWGMGASNARDGNRLAVDSAGNVLVTEAEAHAVVEYDPSGKELHRWTYTANGKVLTPAGIAPLGNDHFLILFPQDNTAVAFSPGGR